MPVRVFISALGEFLYPAEGKYLKYFMIRRKNGERFHWQDELYSNNMPHMHTWNASTERDSQHLY
jgi:hypothetical protein